MTGGDSQSSVSVWERTAPSSADYSPIFPLTRSEHSFFLISIKIGFIVFAHYREAI